MTDFIYSLDDLDKDIKPRYEGKVIPVDFSSTKKRKPEDETPEPELDSETSKTSIRLTNTQENILHLSHVAPAFNLVAIRQYVSDLFSMANGVSGKFVVGALTTVKGASPHQISHFRADGGPAEMERMIDCIGSFHPSISGKSLNVYCTLSLMRPDLEPGKKGTEADVIISFAGVADIDCDKDESPDLAVNASARLETSSGNFQDHFRYIRPLSPSEAKSVALAIHRLTYKNDDPSKRGDSAAKDIGRMWRVPGTLNFPVDVKLARGRDPQPFLIRWAHREGGLIDPATIISAAGPEPERTPPRPLEPLSPHDTLKLTSALESLHPDVLPKDNPPECLRDFWIKVGMSLHPIDGGLKLFDAWSQKSIHYNRDELILCWEILR